MRASGLISHAPSLWGIAGSLRGFLFLLDEFIPRTLEVIDTVLVSFRRPMMDMITGRAPPSLVYGVIAH